MGGGASVPSEGQPPGDPRRSKARKRALIERRLSSRRQSGGSVGKNKQNLLSVDTNAPFTQEVEAATSSARAVQKIRRDLLLRKSRRHASPRARGLLSSSASLPNLGAHGTNLGREQEITLQQQQQQQQQNPPKKAQSMFGLSASPAVEARVGKKLRTKRSKSVSNNSSNSNGNSTSKSSTPSPSSPSASALFPVNVKVKGNGVLVKQISATSVALKWGSLKATNAQKVAEGMKEKQIVGRWIVQWRRHVSRRSSKTDEMVTSASGWSDIPDSQCRIFATTAQISGIKTPCPPLQFRVGYEYDEAEGDEGIAENLAVLYTEASKAFSFAKSLPGQIRGLRCGARSAHSAELVYSLPANTGGSVIEKVKFLGRKRKAGTGGEGDGEREEGAKKWGDWQPFAFQELSNDKEVLRFHLGKRGSGTIASLSALSAYEVKAAAKNESGWGPWCAPISVTTLKEVPGEAGRPRERATRAATRMSADSSSARERVALALSERAARNASVMLSSWLNTSRVQSQEGPKPILIAVLRHGWTECFDPASERVYYCHEQRNISQWEMPREALRRSSSSFSQRQPRNKKASAPALPQADAPFRHKRFKFLWHVRGPIRGSCKVVRRVVRRDNILLDTFDWFRTMSTEELRAKPKIEFKGEVGIDSGGLTKDWFLEVSRALLAREACLFRRHDDSGLYFVDERSAAHPNCKELFRFAGQVLAKAVFERQLVAAPFCLALFKILAGRESDGNGLEMNGAAAAASATASENESDATLTLQDLKEVRPQYAKSLQWILDCPRVEEHLPDQTFTIEGDYFGKTTIHNLCEKGDDISLNDDNKGRYVALVVEWLLRGQVRQQLDALCEGFNGLIPARAWRVFSTEEMSQLLNGVPSVDCELLQESAVYRGDYSSKSAPIKLFWDYFEDASEDQRAAIIKFTTGTANLPLDGLEPPLTIVKSELGPGALPSSHTCFNQLVLPPYESHELLAAKFAQALEMGGAGFQMS